MENAVLALTESKLSPQDYQAESDALDGRFCSERPQESTTRLLLRACWRLGVLRPWSYAVGQELRSCFVRIGTILRLRTVPINSLGPQFGIDSSTGRLTVCSRTRGRRLDTHKFLNTGYRSPSDLEIYLTGWNAGARWCDRNEHLCTPDKESGLLACMEPPR